MRQKGKAGWLLALCLVAAVCTVGCGGEYSAQSQKDGSSGSVSEQAVSGRAVERDATEKRKVALSEGESVFRYANSTNFCYMSESEDDCLFLYTLDGKKKTKILDGIPAIPVMMTEDSLYYATTYEDDPQGLYRIPLHKGSDGTDVAEPDKTETIIKYIVFNEVYGNGICVKGDSIYYVQEEDWKYYIIQYDVKKKKEIFKICLGEKYVSPDEVDDAAQRGKYDIYLPGMIGDRLYVFLTGGGTRWLFSLDTKTGKWTRERKDRDSGYTWGFCEKNLYLGVLSDYEEEEFQRFNLIAVDENGCSEVLVTNEKIRQLLVQGNILRDENETYFIDEAAVYPCGRQIYFNLEFYVNYKWNGVCFCYDIYTGECRLVQELSKRQKETEKFERNLAAIHNGKAVFWAREKYKDKFELSCYDIKEKKEKELTARDSEYYMYAYVNYDFVLRDLPEDFNSNSGCPAGCMQY